ncbi:hypothetical protein [Candidatus Methanocrinis natronophilus]|uniref:Ada metal-binding domain-containing protein n=1 Tax=Candidatus Methanocrinis natronophilus TaxID=3033396 RepID=A0ABT5X6G9_9EURY|nr:hypothetical protein [Candidatus Methanocrinis natronophilus]MDF0590298.1 Ada metal-binding domain-containing protein [Candidatus Methanocrinis natronophilus]
MMMVLGLDLGRLKESLKALDIADLVEMAEEMDWTALSSSPGRSDLEELKRSLNEDDLMETLLLLKEMDLDALIESSKSSTVDELKRALGGVDLKKGVAALGLILMVKRGLVELGQRGEDGEAEAGLSSSSKTEVEVEREAEDGGKGGLVGSGGSDKYHRRDCRLASRISPKNKVIFSGVAEAESQGYKPCALCHP